MDDKILNVAVDVGRSTVKTCYSGSSVLVTKSYISRAVQSPVISAVSFDAYSEEVEVGGDRWFLGDRSLSCNPDSSYFLGESSAFHDFSVLFILYHLAVVSHCSGVSTVNLAINLTFDSQSYSNMYSKRLKGSHTVGIVVNGVRHKVKFMVNRMFCFFQGYSSLFTAMSDRSLRGSSVLVVDVGAQTVDVSLVRSFTLEAGRTFNLGMNRLISDLKADFLAAGVVLSDSQVSDILTSECAAVTSLSGKTVDVRLILRSNLDVYAAVVLDGLKVFVGDRLCDSLVVVGGGASLLRPYLSKVFPSIPVCNLHQDSMMANAFGMLAFLDRL